MNHGKQGSNTEYANEQVANVRNQDSVVLGPLGGTGKHLRVVSPKEQEGTVQPPGCGLLAIL